MKAFSIYIVTLLIGFFVASCATKPSVEQSESATKWDSKAILINKKDSKQQSLSILLIGSKEGRLRMEITATLGYQVGSIVANRNSFKAAVYPQKTYYEGLPTSEALYKLIRIPIEPLILLNIAYEQQIKVRGWLCQNDSANFIARCVNQSLGIEIKWTERKGGRKLVLLSSQQFEMRWLFEAPQSDSALKSTIFDLESPAGFKTIQIN